VVYFGPHMKPNAFRLLTHEEFAQLPTEEKFAYLARAVDVAPGAGQPPQPRRKPRANRTAPGAARAGLSASRSAATSGSE